MSTFIKLEQGFYRNRKTLRLRRSIGNDAWWIPPRLWLLCVERRSDDLSGYTPEDLAACLEYEGDAKALFTAMVEAELITIDGKVAGWEERYGKAMTFYEDRARKAANARWGKGEVSRQLPNTELIQEETRLDQTSKHRVASSKHPTSMLEALVQEENPTASPSRARPPSLDEWIAEAKQKRPAWPQADAENAWNHYEKVGWYSGKTKVRKWQACIMTCFNNWQERNKGRGTASTVTMERKPAAVPDNNKYIDER